MNSTADHAPDDRDLLSAVAQGNRDAFASLFDRHGRSVFAFAATHLPTREDAEEVSQDAWLTLWKKRSTVLIVGSSALPWLLVTCRNLARNRARALNALDHRMANRPEDAPATEPGPEKHVERHELRDYVNAAVEKLPPADQRIFELCLVEGRSYEDAAAAVGLSEAAVRNRLSRLRARLRTELKTLRGNP